MTPDTRPTILVVNHNKTDRCGVYQMGKTIVDILQGSEKYRFVGVRCDCLDAYIALHRDHDPSLTIFNYYPGTMDWVPDFSSVPAGKFYVGLAHEVTHADAHTPRPPFAKWIVTDPSFPESEIYFKTVRPLPKYTGTAKPPKDGPLTIGTFGYAFPNKGFENVLMRAAEEFGPDCLVRMHVTVPHFDGGIGAVYLNRLREWLQGCAELSPACPRVELTTDHWDDAALLDWLAGNHLNCLFYDPNPGRGVSSAVDWCVAAGRPLAITESEQFRHITGLLGTWPQVSLRESLSAAHRQTDMVPTPTAIWLQERWSHANFIADYERIVDALLGGGES